ncbi:hypothetical protein ACROYT_G004735 [Oculina patagonica]
MCRDGKDGRDGRDGRNGVKGEKGKPGVWQGDGGINGAKGEKGQQGLRRNDGINGTKGVKGEQGIRGSDGINGTKGHKGERGLPGKSPHGAIKFSDTAENCSLRTAGTVRYNTSQKALELCDGSAWFPLVIARKGHVAYDPGRHCLDILNSGQSRGSGLYWIDPNGGSTDDSFQAFCDMDTERGGWTLFATKVSPSFRGFIKTGFSALAAKTKFADAASHIHPAMGDWEEVMFRFSDVNTIRVIYNRKAGAPQNNKKEFEEFLMGKTASLMKDVHGFYKYSPADNNKRSPAQGFATISKLHFYSNHAISEWYAGTDKWLNMWTGPDSTNNYVTSDDSRARGTKCIAGYCYLNKPIWVMVETVGMGKTGKKGEPGSSSNPSHGAIKFSYTADTCSLHTAGTVRYSSSQNALQLCDGSAWLSVLTAGKGHVASNPGRHCLDILNSGQSRGSGFYWIDPNGGSTDDSFQAFCDMNTERGGWTLVATKVSPSFPFIKTGFSTLAAKTKYADAASHIHPDMRDWEEVMFRFADVNTIRVIYNRKAGAPQKDKSDFDEFLMGKSATYMDKKVYGFYKYSPADHNKRTPAVGFGTITRLAIGSTRGISEFFADSDKWLDMWHHADGSNSYVTSDDSRARGTKCIAGYCYLNKPIWVMVR